VIVDPPFNAGNGGAGGDAADPALPRILACPEIPIAGASVEATGLSSFPWSNSRGFFSDDFDPEGARVVLAGGQSYLRCEVKP
jgi:hypothetical protein